MKYRFYNGQLTPVDQIPRVEPESDTKSDIFAEPRMLGEGRWRRIDGEWVPIGGDNGLPEHVIPQGAQIIRDLEPYKPVAVDKHTGKRPVIGGRRQHREFLKRNGYIEYGNDFVPNRRDDVSSQKELVNDIKRAMNTL